MLVNWRVNNSASVNRKQNAFILGIEEQMNACKMPKLFCFLSQIKVDNGPFFFFSNFQRKKRNAFAFFPVAFPLLFIFASVVFPQILLVFFLKVIWCTSWVLVGLLRTCAVSRTRILFFFFLLHFSNKMCLADFWLYKYEQKGPFRVYVWSSNGDWTVMAWRYSSDISVSQRKFN